MLTIKWQWWLLSSSTFSRKWRISSSLTPTTMIFSRKVKAFQSYVQKCEYNFNRKYFDFATSQYLSSSGIDGESKTWLFENRAVAFNLFLYARTRPYINPLRSRAARETSQSSSLTQPPWRWIPRKAKSIHNDFQHKARMHRLRRLNTELVQTLCRDQAKYWLNLTGRP